MVRERRLNGRQRNCKLKADFKFPYLLQVGRPRSAQRRTLLVCRRHLGNADLFFEQWTGTSISVVMLYPCVVIGCKARAVLHPHSFLVIPKENVSFTARGAEHYNRYDHLRACFPAICKPFSALLSVKMTPPFCLHLNFIYRTRSDVIDFID